MSAYKNADVKKEEVHNIHYEEIGNTTFKVVSYYSTERTYEDIVKSALLREMGKNY